MALNTDDIREKLRVLGDREWPAEWGAHEEATVKDYLGWCHRYRLEEPASEQEVAAFENAHSIVLPGDYRQFLLGVGNGAAGPGYGIWPLGEGEDGASPQEMLDGLSTPFIHTDAWNNAALLQEERGYPDEEYYVYEQIAGALEIATDGCALYHLLVVSGPGRGQIWYDKRTEGKGIEPVRNSSGQIMHFAEWYMAWLDDVWTRFAP